MTEPHAFQALKPGSNRCRKCGGWSDAAYHSQALWSDVDREREAMRQLSEAERLTARLRTVKGDVSRAAGIMERESPLFLGSGSNPSLF